MSGEGNNSTGLLWTRLFVKIIIRHKKQSGEVDLIGGTCSRCGNRRP